MSGLAFLLFALGIIGTGLLAIPVLAGSAAYAVAEVFGWPSTLEAKFPEAIGFYAIIFAATIIWIRDGILADQPDSAACLDRCHQRNRRRSHHGDDDADRD